MKTLTKEQKLLWNKAIKAAANEAYLYDGFIPKEGDRKFMKVKIIEKLSYKIKS